MPALDFDPAALAALYQLYPAMDLTAARSGPDAAFSFATPASYAAFAARKIKGVRFPVAPEKHRQLLQQVRTQLGGAYTVYRSAQNFGHRPDELTVLATPDPYDALLFEGTNGANHGHLVEDIIAHLRAMAVENPFELTDVSFDTVAGDFMKLPRDVEQLARTMYAFCPDIVDQGTKTVAALAESIEILYSFYYWWD